MIGGIATLSPGDLAARPDSVGQVNPLVEVQIVDSHDRPVEAGAPGRLRLRGPALGTPLAAPGGGATEEFHDGWYYPGEIAARDGHDFLFIHGRASDVIMRGGAKIHPAEIEAVLLEHTAVAEAAVIGVAAGSNEPTVAAFVVARAPVAAGLLLAHCRARLTPYKVPRDIRLVAALPKNTAGKVDRTALAAMAARPS